MSYHQGSIGSGGSKDFQRKGVTVITKISIRDLTCPTCLQKVAPLDRDRVVIDGQNYHWSEIIQGDGRRNGKKEVYQRLGARKAELQAKQTKSELDFDESNELHELKKVPWF